MKNFKQELNNVLEMLTSIEDEINLAGYTLTEKKVFFTITQLNVKNSVCNISDVINSSNLSRSTVYKAIKKLERNTIGNSSIVLNSFSLLETAHLNLSTAKSPNKGLILSKIASSTSFGKFSDT